MKFCGVICILVSACVVGTLAGSDGTCPAYVGEWGNLSDNIKETLKYQASIRKDLSEQEFAEQMDAYITGMLARNTLSPEDQGILERFMNIVEPRGDITIRIKVWRCVIDIHIKW